MKALGSWEELKGDFEGDSEQALVAGEEAAPVRTDEFAARSAPFDHFTGGQRAFETENVVGSHTVFEAVGSAGVEGDVSADGAN